MSGSRPSLPPIKPGDRFGHLVVKDEVKIGRYWMVNCQCDCGKMTQSTRSRLFSGNTKSCSCQQSVKGRKISWPRLTKHSVGDDKPWTFVDGKIVKS